MRLPRSCGGPGPRRGGVSRGPTLFSSLPSRRAAVAGSGFRLQAPRRGSPRSPSWRSAGPGLAAVGPRQAGSARTWGFAARLVLPRGRGTPWRLGPGASTSSGSSPRRSTRPRIIAPPPGGQVRVPGGVDAVPPRGVRGRSPPARTLYELTAGTPGATGAPGARVQPVRRRRASRARFRPEHHRRVHLPPRFRGPPRPPRLIGETSMMGEMGVLVR